MILQLKNEKKAQITDKNGSSTSIQGLHAKLILLPAYEYQNSIGKQSNHIQIFWLIHYFCIVKNM